MESIPADSLSEYNVGVLLALALSDGYIRLRREKQQVARLLLEGELALVMNMIRLEPQLMHFIENVEILKRLLEKGLSLAKTGIELQTTTETGKKVSALLNRAVAKTGLPIPVNKVGRVGLDALIKSGVADFQAIRDRMLLASGRARGAFARRQAEVELRDAPFPNERARERAVEMRADELLPQLVEEAAVRQKGPRIDGRDWKLPVDDAVPQGATRHQDIAHEAFGKPYESLNASEQQAIRIRLNQESMTRAVFGPDFAEAQLELVDYASNRLLLETSRAQPNDLFERLLGKLDAPALPRRASFAELLEKDELFNGADGERVIAAIRNRQVDLTFDLQDEAGRYAHLPPDRISGVQALEQALAFTDATFDQGWSRTRESASHLEEARRSRQAIFDAWYGEFLAEEAQILRMIGKLSDDVADAFVVSVGGSYES